MQRYYQKSTTNIKLNKKYFMNYFNYNIIKIKNKKNIYKIFKYLK